MCLDGYRGFDALLAANMAHAGALRIDHVMGLARLFWVPEGAQGTDGAYISYPINQLLGSVALASHRASTMVIGEDLGTVPEGFRDTLAKAGILGYQVMLLERHGLAFRPPSSFPALSLASVTSHDLPTLAGWWRGTDIGERRAIGQLSPDESDSAKVVRQLEKAELVAIAGVDRSLVGHETLPAVIDSSIHAALARASSLLVMIQADGLSGEETGVNLPGTDRERPNWRHKVKRPLTTLFTDGAAYILRLVAAARQC
jgi:glycogen operon protein